MAKYISALMILLVGCTSNGYYNNYYTFTDYDEDRYQERMTPGGVTIFSNQSINVQEVDKLVDELEECLGVPIHRDWFALLVPDASGIDPWFTSECTGEQQLPFAAPAKYCRDKGLEIAEECEGTPFTYRIPTPECRCVCNWRVATQWDYYIITPPKMKLVKAELARMVTGVNSPWSDDYIKLCL